MDPRDDRTQQECIEKLGPIEKMEAPLSIDYSDEIYAAVEAAGTERIAETQKIADKTDRQNAEAEVNAALVAELEGRFADTDDAVKQIKAAARSVMKKVVRKRIVEEGIRIDGRGAADLRKVTSEVGVIPTSHGSGLFQRGETQVLNITTLGMGRSDMMIDDLSPLEKKRYFTTTTSRPSRRVRPASCAVRSVARSVTVRSPSVRSPRSSRALRNGPTPSAPSPRSWPRTVRPRWVRSVARPCR